MNPEGRPKTRTREDMLIAVYRLVHSRMIRLESTNVTKACKDVFSNNDVIIKFYDPKNVEYRSLFDVVKDSGNLRKRFYDAKKAALNKTEYPHLHQIVEHLNAQLPMMIEQHRQWRVYMESVKNNGENYLWFDSQAQIDAHLQNYPTPR